MREIKFRGRRVDNGEWVYGDIYQPNIDNPLRHRYGEVYIHSRKDGSYYHVDPATVGQLTGLLDSQKTIEIYEGDILDLSCEWQFGRRGIVIYKNGCFCCQNKDRETDVEPLSVILEVYENAEVIGNIHDNPELSE